MTSPTGPTRINRKTPAATAHDLLVMAGLDPAIHVLGRAGDFL